MAGRNGRCQNNAAGSDWMSKARARREQRIPLNSTAHLTVVQQSRCRREHERQENVASLPLMQLGIDE